MCSYFIALVIFLGNGNSSSCGNEMCTCILVAFCSKNRIFLRNEILPAVAMKCVHVFLLLFAQKTGYLFCSVRVNRAKATDFWENFSAQLHDDDFRRFYRMDRSTLSALTQYLNPQARQYQGGRKQVSPHKAVAITLCYLGSKFTYKQLAGIFGLSDECVFAITENIMKLLNDRCGEIIKWPKKQEYEAIASEFNRKKKRRFPNIIGAIDGCHVRISHSKDEEKAYYNYKHFHSVQLQAVCSFDRKFIDIFAG